MKLLLAVPSAGAPSRPFIDSLTKLRLPAECLGFEYSVITGNFVPGQRELATRHATTLGADFLMMVDDDMVVPEDAAEKLYAVLMSDERVAVAGALYYSRDGIRPMVVSGWSSSRTVSGWIPQFATDPTPVDGVGFGCVMIRVPAFDSLKPPYFAAQIYVEQSAARVRLCNEDYLLCERLRGAGFTIMLHPGVRAGHYDRASGVTMPVAWEPTDLTSRKRMIVANPGPSFRLTDYDNTVPQAPEIHELGTLDYLFVD